MSAADFGTDFSTYPDLDWGRKLSGPEAVVQACTRGLEDHHRGVDLRQWLNRALGPADLYAIEQAVRSRFLADERVQSVAVQVTSPSLLELQVAVEAVLEQDGTTFRRVLRITQLGLEVFRET